MEFETLLVALLPAALTLPLVVRAWRRWSWRNAIALGLLWVMGSGAVAWAAHHYEPPQRAAIPVTNRPIENPINGYISSKACRSCHPHEYDTWHDSYHRRMTQVATPETVEAPWPDGTLLQAYGQSFLLKQAGDKFLVQMDDPNWRGDLPAPRVWQEVALITGSHHFQFYHLTSGKKRRMTIFPFCYRIADKPRWMPLDGCCVGSPFGRQESGTARWNRVCIKCHATNGRPRIEQLGEGQMNLHNVDTHVTEFGIACEACHGPGERHVRANRDPSRRYTLHTGADHDDTIVNPANLSKDASAHACGQCHGLVGFKTDADRADFRQNGFKFRPGQVLTDTVNILPGGEDRFWSDGMLRVSGREYMGMAEAPCYLNGEMTCLSCHQMHQTRDDPRSRLEWADDQLKPGMRGNEACLQCHDAYRDADKLTEHTHHEADSTGSNCYNCHMSYTAYGLLKAIRTHQVNNPTIASTLATGRPHACNQCHLDKTLQWTAEHVRDWYGQDVPDLTEDNRTVAAGLLWLLRGDAGQRALLAWSFGWDDARAVSGTDWLTPYLGILLNDPYMAVRYIADRSLWKQADVAPVAYDFIDSTETREAKSLRVIDHWLKARDTSAAPRPELLLLQGGQLDEARVSRILGERDNRKVTLNE